MPNDERILETMPCGTLGIITTESCTQLGKMVNDYLAGWRKHREHEHKKDFAFNGYYRENYIIEPYIPRFGSGEAKCVINQSVRGYDLYIMVDVTNYSMTYSLYGQENHMSPDDHFAD
ncbi:MAG: ribose-phosphate pyrophosphokinase-like domain-containing protein, partial [Clostridiales bacterium]|nr:ribose-phosphate pyrophosphokinase-like domain-containing protein [Clostridiales bacterium]